MELHESSDDGIGFEEEDEKARKSSRKAPATKGSAAKQSASVKSAPSTAAAKKEDMDKEKEEEEKQDEAAAKKKAKYVRLTRLHVVELTSQLPRFQSTIRRRTESPGVKGYTRGRTRLLGRANLCVHRRTGESGQG